MHRAALPASGRRLYLAVWILAGCSSGPGAATDGSADRLHDAAGDGAADAMSDATVDAPAEATSDVTVDATPDVTVDAMPTEPARAAALSARPPASGFGDIEVGVVSDPLTWIVTNTGDAPTGTLNLANGNPTEATVTNSCPATLDPGASCQVGITFKPATVGPRSASVVI